MTFDEKNMVIKRILIILIGLYILVPFHIAGAFAQLAIDDCGMSVFFYGIPKCIADSIGLFIGGLICGKIQPPSKNPLLDSLIFNLGIANGICVLYFEHMALPAIYLLIPVMTFWAGCSLSMLKKKIEPSNREVQETPAEN